MRELIKHFVSICAETLPISEPIYEFGALQVPGQEGFADLRPLFPGKRYVGADMRNGVGVDRILDLHHIDLPSDSVNTVLLLDTLEHVEFPRKAIEEVHRVLGANGILILSSVMNCPIHDHPHDFWRFTPDAFRSLLKPFDSFVVDFAGDSDFPHTVVGIGFKGKIPVTVINNLTKRLENWRSQWRDPPLPQIVYIKPQMPGRTWKDRIRAIVPLILLNQYRKFLKTPKVQLYRISS